MSRINHNKDKKERQMSSCEKTQSIESIKCKKSLFKLKQQENLMVKSLLNLTENIKLGSKVAQFVWRDMNDISKKREALLENVKKSLGEITEEFKSAKSVIDCPEQIKNLDTNAYKQRLMKLSQKIRDFEESCQFESLSQEQKTLESELREFELNLHKYQNVTCNVNKPMCAVSFSKNVKGSHNKEIQDFHALIAKTGHTGNWSEEDHLLFLKTRQKISNIPALVTAIQAKCPDLTAENIVNHEAWYKVYLNLREKQRSTIREWHKQKETGKVRKIRDKTEIENAEQIFRTKSNSDITEKLPLCATNNREARAAMHGKVINDDGVNQKKELIRQWKVEKEKKRSIEEQQSKMLKESKIAAHEKLKQERLKRIQATLAEYHKKKLTELSTKASKDDSRAERKYDPALIEAFRRQDEEYTRRRKRVIATLRKPTKGRMARNVRSQVTRTRDHSTLLNPTKVWSERCKIQDPDAKEPRKLQYIKDVPRLYVQWRNKESKDIRDVPTFA